MNYKNFFFQDINQKKKITNVLNQKNISSISFFQALYYTHIL